MISKVNRIFRVFLLVSITSSGYGLPTGQNIQNDPLLLDTKPINNNQLNSNQLNNQLANPQQQSRYNNNNADNYICFIENLKIFFISFFSALENEIRNDNKFMESNIPYDNIKQQNINRNNNNVVNDNKINKNDDVALGLKTEHVEQPKTNIKKNDNKPLPTDPVDPSLNL